MTKQLDLKKLKIKRKAIICNKCEPHCKCKGYSLTYTDLKNVEEIYKENRWDLSDFFILHFGALLIFLLFCFGFFYSLIAFTSLMLIYILVMWPFKKTWKQTIKYWKKK